MDPELTKILGLTDRDPPRIHGASGSNSDLLRIRGASFSLKEVQAIAALAHTGRLALSRETRESLADSLQASGERFYSGFIQFVLGFLAAFLVKF